MGDNERPYCVECWPRRVAAGSKPRKLLTTETGERRDTFRLIDDCLECGARIDYEDIEHCGGHRDRPRVAGRDRGGCAGLVAVAGTVRVRGAELRSESFGRYSARQNKRVPHRALLGRVRLEGKHLDDLAPLLALREALHLGKGTLSIEVQRRGSGQMRPMQ